MNGYATQATQRPYDTMPVQPSKGSGSCKQDGHLQPPHDIDPSFSPIFKSASTPFPIGRLRNHSASLHPFPDPLSASCCLGWYLPRLRVPLKFGSLTTCCGFILERKAEQSHVDKFVPRPQFMFHIFDAIPAMSLLLIFVSSIRTYNDLKFRS